VNNGHSEIEPPGLACARPAAFTRPQLLIVAAALVAIILIASAGYQDPGALMDEGTLLVYPERVLKGDLPYRDFETFYAPANIYVLAAVYRLFGVALHVERTVGLFYRLAIIAALFTLIRRFSFILALGCMLVAGLLLTSLGLIASAWLGASACALWALVGLSAPSRNRQEFLGGILAGAALLFRADFVPAMLMASVALLLQRSRNARWRFVFGVSLALTPLALLALAAGARPLYENLLLLPVVRGNGGRHLPWATLSPDTRWLFMAHLVACLINCAAAVIALRAEPGRSDNRLLLSVALLGCGVTHQAVQRMDPAHLLSAAFISLATLPVALVLLSEGRNFLRPAARAVAATAAVAIAIGLADRHIPIQLARYLSVIGSSAPDANFWVEQNERSFRFAAVGQARATRRLLDQLQRMSKPGERLFVGPADMRRTNYNDTIIYHLMPQLEPATYFLEMNPGSANRERSRLAADIASADWVVLDRSLDAWREPNASSRNGSPLPNQVVLRQFQMLGQFAAYSLWQRRATPAL
jgi:hypothetical protein